MKRIEKDTQDICRHDFVPLGFEMIDKNEKEAEFAGAAICRYCRLVYTKLLKFDRLRQ